jgi:hypothetical protein
VRGSLIVAAIVAALIAAAWLLNLSAPPYQGDPAAACRKLPQLQARMECVDAASAKAEAGQ